jgi:GAF domain-containing protein
MDLENRELQLLRTLNQTIGSSLDLAKILHQIVDIVMEITQGDSCLIYLLSRGKKRLILKASSNRHSDLLGKIAIKMGEGITGVVAQDKSIIAIPRRAYDDPRFKAFPQLPEDRYEAFLSVPLVAKGNVIGVINVQHLQEHDFTEAEIALVDTAAQYAGASMMNARLYEETRKKARQLEALANISRRLVSGQLFEETLTFIASTAAEIAKMQVCSIMLLSEDQRSFNFRAIACPDRAYHGTIQMPMAHTACGQACQTRRPVYIRDVKKDAHYALPELAQAYNLCSMLSIPMLLKEKAIGVVNVYTQTPHQFTDEEIQLLQAIANHAAATIYHAQLAKEIVQSKNDLATQKKLQRAKGILMKDYHISEDEAHKLLLHKSMNLGKPLSAIAETIILGAEIRP